MSKGGGGRQRILEVAREAVLAKGFDATSIEEIVAAADITRSGFFYHFRDKNELARALLEQYVEEETELLSGLFARGRELHDDPLHAFLIGLKLLAELVADLPNGHPGCLVATACYQDRLFDAEIRALNRQAVLVWRAVILKELERVAAAYPPRAEVSVAALADMILTTIEGGIVMSKALRDPRVMADQILLQRDYIRLLFQPAAA
jgi:TetR/AcrR family transcriptional regulator, transcriptional repressor for nem operon